MITSKLRRFIRASAEVLALYQEHNSEGSYVEIIPFVDKDDKDSEVVTMVFKDVTEFSWQFLEPLTKYFVAKKLNWSINIGIDDKHELVINIS